MTKKLDLPLTVPSLTKIKVLTKNFDTNVLTKKLFFTTLCDVQL